MSSMYIWVTMPRQIFKAAGKSDCNFFVVAVVQHPGGKSRLVFHKQTVTTVVLDHSYSINATEIKGGISHKVLPGYTTLTADTADTGT